jgi:hypothetical protein
MPRSTASSYLKAQFLPCLKHVGFLARFGESSIYEFYVELSSGTNATKVIPPKGEQGKIDANTIRFLTDDKPLDAGKKFSFRIYSSSTTNTFYWSAHDADGNSINDGLSKIRFR